MKKIVSEMGVVPSATIANPAASAKLQREMLAKVWKFSARTERAACNIGSQLGVSPYGPLSLPMTALLSTESVGALANRYCDGVRSCTYWLSRIMEASDTKSRRWHRGWLMFYSAIYICLQPNKISKITTSNNLCSTMSLDVQPFASPRLLFQPSATHDARVEAFRRFVNRKHGLHLSAYPHLHYPAIS
jgi:hypothetical protein